MSDLKSHETVCTDKKNNQTITYQHCPECKRWFGTQQFHQHACLEGLELPALLASASGSGDSVISMDDALSPEAKFNRETADIYKTETMTEEIGTSNPELSSEWYTTGVNVAEIKTESEANMKIGPSSTDEYNREIKDKSDDIAPLFHTGNILVIKPETEMDRIPQPYETGNVLVIKPENEIDIPEHCRDVTGMQNEKEAGLDGKPNPH